MSTHYFHISAPFSIFDCRLSHRNTGISVDKGKECKCLEDLAFEIQSNHTTVGAFCCYVSQLVKECLSYFYKRKKRKNILRPEELMVVTAAYLRENRKLFQ